MLTTCIGVSREQMSVNLTTSENKIDTLSKVCIFSEKYPSLNTYILFINRCIYYLTSIHRVFPITQTICDLRTKKNNEKDLKKRLKPQLVHLLWNHLIKKLIRSLYQVVQRFDTFSQLLWFLLLLVQGQFKLNRLLSPSQHQITFLQKNTFVYTDNDT